jgi:phospholipid/cholesterol/gamma-HCH transport system substrate-binding protein
VNHALVGLFVVLLTAGLIFGGLWFAAGFDDGDSRRYSVYITDSVYGLTRDSPVTFYGVSVGRVVSLEVTRQDPNRVHVVVEVQDSAPVRDGTVATLKLQGLTGLAYIELTGGGAGETEIGNLPGTPYPVIPYQESLLMRLDTAITEGMDSVETLGERLTALLSPENTQALNRLLTNLATISDNLVDPSARLDDTLDQLQALLAAGEVTAEQTVRTLERIRESLAGVDRMSASIANAGGELAALGSEGEAGMRRLRTSTLPQVEALVAELRRLTAEAERLTESLRRNPGQLLERAEPIPLGPGEGDR